jgi:hypothetical protein
LVDAPFQEVLTGDPFFYSYQHKAQQRAPNQTTVQAATMHRMLEHNRQNNIEIVPPEKRKHSLVLKADFPALEERKKIAAMKWMEAHAWQYQHTQNQVEKKAEWEMQRQDA